MICKPSESTCGGVGERHRGCMALWQLEHFLSLRKNERFLNKEAQQNWKPCLCCLQWHNKYPRGLVSFHLLPPINEIEWRKSVEIVFPLVNKKKHIWHQGQGAKLCKA